MKARFVQWDGKGSAQDYVISKNLHRRHLNAGQRAMIAAKIAKRPFGDQGGTEISIPTIKQAADLLNVNPATVHYAKVVQKEGTPEEIEAVEKGEAAVSTMAKKIRQRQDWVKILSIFPT